MKQNQITVERVLDTPTQGFFKVKLNGITEQAFLFVITNDENPDKCETVVKEKAIEYAQWLETKPAPELVYSNGVAALETFPN